MCQLLLVFFNLAFWLVLSVIRTYQILFIRLFTAAFIVDERPVMVMKHGYFILVALLGHLFSAVYQKLTLRGGLAEYVWL